MANPQTEQKVEEELGKEDENLKGTFTSVMMLGGFLVLSWVGVWILYLIRYIGEERNKLMKMHKYEKIWLSFVTGCRLIFLIVVCISAFYMGNQPPSCAVTLNPEKVDQTEPFNEPGLKQIGDNEYQLTIVASAFNYDVGTDDKIVEIPKGATVHF